jgi:Novel toxin 11
MSLPLVRNPLRSRPSNQEYAGVDDHRRWLNGLTAGQLMRHDAQMWHMTGVRGVGAPQSHKNEIVQNLFKVVRFGGLMCCPDPTAGQYSPWPYNIAPCISHGGRVLIQIAKVSPLESSGVDHSFWRWFRGQSPLSKRVGTHSVKRYGDQYQVLANDRLKYLKETGGAKKGAGQFVKQMFQRTSNLDAEASFGMNIALGGYGTTSEGRGRVVTDDGTFGHMYLFYIPPSRAECGAILVGVEGEEPGKWGETGNFHSWNIAPIDKLRSNKPNKDMGLTTGPKWEEIGERFEQLVPSKKSGMFVDCTALSPARLATQRFSWDMLYQPTRPLQLNFPAAPLPQTGHGELDAIRKAYMALGRNQFQPRMDRLAAFRAAAQKLRMAPLVATADQAIETLDVARNG